MDPRKTPESNPEDVAEDAPALEQQDWDAVVTGDLIPDSIAETGDLPEEDDDNPYQNSDEALPDDREEVAISRDTSRKDDPLDEI